MQEMIQSTISESMEIPALSILKMLKSLSIMMESLPGAHNLTQTVINTQKLLINLIYDMKDYKAIKLGAFKKNEDNFKLKVAIKDVYQTFLL
jgi:hypothetical protein